MLIFRNMSLAALVCAALQMSSCTSDCPVEDSDLVLNVVARDSMLRYQLTHLRFAVSIDTKQRTKLVELGESLRDGETSLQLELPEGNGTRLRVSVEGFTSVANVEAGRIRAVGMSALPIDTCNVSEIRLESVTSSTSDDAGVQVDAQFDADAQTYPDAETLDANEPFDAGVIVDAESMDSGESVDAGQFYVLKVNPGLGNGTGTVTSNPPGISCPGQCEARFPGPNQSSGGSSVTLEMIPSSGSGFAGWSGDCSGFAECEVTMDGAKDVGAKFEDGLIAFYPFDRNSAQDASGNGHHGTMVNTEWIPSISQFFKAMLFGGLNQDTPSRIEVLPSPALSGMSNLTLCASFVMTSTVPSGQQRVLMGQGIWNNNARDDPYLMSIVSGSAAQRHKLRGYIQYFNPVEMSARTKDSFSQNITLEILDPQRVPAIPRHHYCLVYLTGFVHLYLDGVRVGDNSVNNYGPIITGSSPLVIGDCDPVQPGDNCDENSFFRGFMSDVRIYRRGLSEPEISALANP